MARKMTVVTLNAIVVTPKALENLCASIFRSLSIIQDVNSLIYKQVIYIYTHAHIYSL